MLNASSTMTTPKRLSLGWRKGNVSHPLSLVSCPANTRR